MHARLVAIGFVMIGVFLAGCRSEPAMPEPTGFLSDYSRLEKQPNGWLRFVSGDLGRYDSFLVDPIEIQAGDEPVLSDEQGDEITEYFHAAVVRVLIEHGKTVVTSPGSDTARVRIALTDIRKSPWILKLHPGLKLAGLGRGGAAMEGEIVDALTGEQLAAAIQSGLGSQFELDTFRSLDDVRDVIDAWAVEAGERLDERLEEQPAGDVRSPN